MASSMGAASGSGTTTVTANNFNSLSTSASSSFDPVNAAPSLLQQSYFIMTNEEGAADYSSANNIVMSTSLSGLDTIM